MGEGDAVGKGDGEAVEDGEAVRSVVSSVFSGPLKGADRSVVCGGSYGPLSATDSVIPTTAAAAVATGVSTTTRGTRTNGRTRPSKMYHNNPATMTITPATSHHGCPNIRSSYPPNTPLYQDRASAPSWTLPVSGRGSTLSWYTS